MNAKNPLAVLGVISVIAIVGMIFLFTGVMSGQVAYRPGPFIYIEPDQACARGVMCQYGEGAVPVGTEDSFALCVCPEDIMPETMAEAGSFQRDPSGYYHESKVWKISLVRKY